MVRRGAPLRQVAGEFQVVPSTVLFWTRRAGTGRLDRVDWADRPRGPGTPGNRYPRTMEDLVLRLRVELKKTSDLGEFGAQAIHAALRERGVAALPSVRSIGRILECRGALDGRYRLRRPAPPPGWYLPALAAGQAELDAFDTIEGLVIKGGMAVEVLTGISLHGGLGAAWPRAAITTPVTVDALVAHWREVGLPTHAQFDNDTCFQGAHVHPDTLGQVPRLCLSLGVVPVFVPPRESGFQAAVENFNDRWQAKVWARFENTSREGLQSQSAKYIAASRRKAAPRIGSAPAPAPVPRQVALRPPGAPTGPPRLPAPNERRAGRHLPGAYLPCGSSLVPPPRPAGRRPEGSSHPLLRTPPPGTARATPHGESLLGVPSSQVHVVTQTRSITAVL